METIKSDWGVCFEKSIRYSFLILLTFLVISTASCSYDNDKTTESGTELSENLLTEAQNAYTNLIELLDSEKITKLSITVATPPKGEPVSYDTTDSDTISDWVKLLKKMEISAKPFVGGTGTGYSLSVFAGDDETVLGGFVLPVIYSSDTRIMYTVDNYAALSAEFEALKEKMTSSAQ